MAKAALFVFVVFAVSGGARAQESAGGDTPHGKLTTIRTVCVESFAGEPSLADTAKEMAFAALFSGKRFMVTERCDKADGLDEQTRGIGTQRKELLAGPQRDVAPRLLVVGVGVGNLFRQPHASADS